MAQRERKFQMDEKTRAREIAAMPSTSFKNEYGEKFTLHTNGVSVFMSGDEVNAMVDEKRFPKIDHKYINLFNPGFSIWNVIELDKLGKALQKLAKEVSDVKN